MLTPSQSAVVVQTLRIATKQAMAEAGPGHESASRPEPPHPAWPAPGVSVTSDLVVGADDTAAAMGHPDPEMRVLGSPRLALWFELVACELLPEPGPALTHVGAGILVHHLGRADLGETVRISCTLAEATGRHAVLTARAVVGDRLVALGIHHRVLVSPAVQASPDSRT